MKNRCVLNNQANKHKNESSRGYDKLLKIIKKEEKKKKVILDRGGTRMENSRFCVGG